MGYVIIIIGIYAYMFMLMLHNGKLYTNKNTSIYLIMTMTLCWIVASIRNISVGVDTRNYCRIYYIICESSWKDILSNFKFAGTEIGFNILCKVCSCIYPDYYFFQAVLSAIFCFGFIPFIKKNSKNVVLAMLVFVGAGLYLDFFNIARQLVAVMLFVNAWDLFCEKKYLRSLLLAFLSISFHITAIIYFASIVLYKVWKIARLRKIILVISVLVLFFWEKIIILSTPFVQRYYNYGNYLQNNRERQSAGLVVIMWGIFLALSLYVFFKDQKAGENNIIPLFCILYVITEIIGLEFNYVDRIGEFYMPFIIPLIDRTYFYIKDRVVADMYLWGCGLSFSIYFLLSVQTDQYIYAIF